MVRRHSDPIVRRERPSNDGHPKEFRLGYPPATSRLPASSQVPDITAIIRVQSPRTRVPRTAAGIHPDEAVPTSPSTASNIPRVRGFGTRVAASNAGGSRPAT
nr:hypothetical protein JVH1_6030 [Rhodococcus sp. JVH1]